MRYLIIYFRFLLPGVLFFIAPWHLWARSPDPRSTDKDILLWNSKALDLLYQQPDSCIYYGQKALDRATLLNDPFGEEKALSHIGKAYYIKGAYGRSIQYSMKALSLAEKIHDQQGMVVAHNEIGLVYLGHEQFDLAMNEFLKAIEMAKAAHDSSGISRPMFNAGICYDHNGAFEQALACFHIAAETDKGGHVSLMSINRLGETWLHLKKYDTAVYYYRQLISDPRALNDNWEKAFAYAGLAQVNYEMGRYDSSLAYANRSYTFARLISAKWDIERAVRLLADNYAQLHQYQKAYEYMVLDHSYNDSLYNGRREQVLNFMKLQQEEKENQQLLIESQQDKKMIQLRTALLGGACLLAILLIGVALILYRNYTIKNRLNETLTSSNQLKDQLFSVISHDLRSPMASIQQMLEFIKSKNMPVVEKEKLYDIFYRQVVVSNNMLNNLLQWVTAQLSEPGMVPKKETVDPSQVVEEVLSVYTFLAQEKKIGIDNSLPGGLFVSADKEQLKIIFQNIIGNAVKFTKPGGSIHLYHTSQDQSVTLHIKDTGVGISADRLSTLLERSGPSQSTYGTAREKGTGIGLYLIRHFVVQNGGQFWIHSEEGLGTEMRISFSKS